MIARGHDEEEYEGRIYRNIPVCLEKGEGEGCKCITFQLLYYFRQP